MARSFGASRLKIFSSIILPGTVPFIFTGLKYGAGRALLGVVVGELYAATAGVGHMIADAGNTFQTDVVFFGVLIFTATGLVVVSRCSTGWSGASSGGVRTSERRRMTDVTANADADLPGWRDSISSMSARFSASSWSCCSWCSGKALERGWWADLLRPADRRRRRSAGSSSRSSFPRRPWSREAAFRMFFVTGEIWRDLGWSGLEFVLGLGLAILVGIPLGLAAGWYRRFSYAVEPFLAAFNATPQVAFLPLIIIWVGTGLATKVLIIFLLAVLPIAINAQAAVRTTDARLLQRRAELRRRRLACCSAASSCRARCRSCSPACGSPSGAA